MMQGEGVMDLEYYRNFLTVVQAGTIAEAARRLHIAQPALTYRIAMLEEYLGAPILHTKRGGRKVELTEAGHFLYESAQYLLATEDRLKRSVTQRVEGTAGTLSLALSPSTAAPFLRERLIPFSREYALVKYRIAEVSISVQTKLLLAGDAEIGVANAPLLETEHFRILDQQEEHFVLAAGISKDRFGMDEAPVALDELHNVPVVLSRGCADLFLQACDARALQPDVLSICTTRTAALVWAQANRACAVVPKQPGTQGGMRYHPLIDPPLSVYRSLVIVRDRPLTTPAYNFLQFHHYLPADLM